MAYAIIDIGGKQYRVEKGDSVVVDLVDAEPGAKLSPKAVMFADGKQSIAGGAEAEKIKVDAVVAEHVKGDKIRVFKYKAKKRYRVATGHRSSLTRLEITGITAPGAKPAEKKPAADKPTVEKKPAAAEKKPAAPKKPPAEKAPAEKKPAAKKPAAKKPAAKKPAPKKDE